MRPAAGWSEAARAGEKTEGERMGYKVIALVSGGKDSTLNMMRVLARSTFPPAAGPHCIHCKEIIMP